MIIKRVIVGMLHTNCYILEKDGEALIVDPGDDFNLIKNSTNLNVVGILLTHKHFDHMGALNECINYYNVPLYSSETIDSNEITVGSFNFKVVDNFGHTMDSISFIFDDIMFSGDFVFEGAIGRVDFGGDMNAMKESIKALLKSDINYTIYPGHGNKTKLDDEKNNLLKYI